MCVHAHTGTRLTTATLATTWQLAQHLPLSQKDQGQQYPHSYQLGCAVQVAAQHTLNPCTALDVAAQSSRLRADW